MIRLALALLASVLLAPIAPAHATDLYAGKAPVVIPSPRGGPAGSYALDWCYHAGRDCGKPAADVFCRTKGFDTAHSFKTQHSDYTWIVGEARACHGDYCTAFSEVACVTYESASIGDPMVEGLRADNCRIWAKDCGRGGAKAYCEHRGFNFVDKFEVYDTFVCPTYVIGSRRRCDGPLCRALKSVECHKTLTKAN
jgi:hypothetical protein